MRKIKQLDGKGEKIMTLLEQRELRGIEKGIEQGIEQGIEKGIEKGILLGELKKARELAKNMLMNNEAMEKILMYTGLDKKELEAIKKELEN